MSKEKDKILRTLEHIAITFDKFGFSPTIPICTGHKDFNYLFRLEIDTIKELCDQQAQRITKLEEQLSPKTCPLQLLADHDKKVRAEVMAENQVLKERWEKLKDYVNTPKEFQQWREEMEITVHRIKAKMQELEKG